MSVNRANIIRQFLTDGAKRCQTLSQRFWFFNNAVSNNCMEKNLSLSPNSSSTSRDISQVLWKKKFKYSLLRSPPEPGKFSPYLKNESQTCCHLLFLFHFLSAQHVSDINISIVRSLRLCCCITTSVVLFSVRCVLELWCSWFWVVFVLQAEAQVVLQW